jgi:ATP-dependent helicase/DNAse subunit B
MPRIVKTSAVPIAPDVSKDEFTAITPYASSARFIGVRHRTLKNLAMKILKLRGVDVASPLIAKGILKTVIRDVVLNTDVDSYASYIKQILETVLRTGIDSEDLRIHGSPRTEEVAKIAAEYRLRLREQNLVDPVELLWEAAAEPVGDKRKLYIYGYHRARKEEIHFINAIADEDSIYYLPCHKEEIFAVNRQWAEWLEERGWQIDARPSSDEESVGSDLALKFLRNDDKTVSDSGAEAFVYPDIDSEVRGVLASIKHLLISGTPSADIAMVCRDRTVYGPFIAGISKEYGLPVKMPYRIPLTETSFGNFLSLVFRAVESDLAFEDILRMLMHPLGQGLKPDVWKLIQKKYISTAEEWLENEVDLGCLQWAEKQTASNWVDCLRKSLRILKVRRQAAKQARDLLACNCLEGALEEFARTEHEHSLTRREFITEIREMLASLTVPFSTLKVGVELYEPNLILGASFRHVFVMGMAEGMLPATVADNPVVDFYERKHMARYGIDFEEAAEVQRWEALSFYFLLLTVGENITFSYPRTVGNDLKIENSYFKKLELTPQAVSKQSFISSIEEERRVYLRQHCENGEDTVFAFALRQLAAEQDRESNNSFGEFDGVVGIPIDAETRRWSVSQLTSIGQCSFKWFANKILKLEPLDKIDRGLSPLKKGLLYHNVLEIAVGKALSEAGDMRKAVLLNLAEAFDEAERNPKLALTDVPNWTLARSEHLKALRRAVESDAFITAGAKPVAVEKKYEGEWCGLAMNGFIDRVDHSPDGILAIDYKTGSAKPKGIKNELGKMSVDVQLPIYIKVALPALYPESPVAGGSYYSLTTRKPLAEVGSDYPPELDTFAEKVKQILKDGTYPVDPDMDRYACMYCDYDIVCRKGQRLYRKENSQ